MKKAPCPHCNNEELATEHIPAEVIAVVSCPACRELVILFRGQAIGLNRTILESGTPEQRKAHLAEILGQLLDSGILPAVANFFAAQEAQSMLGENQDECESCHDPEADNPDDHTEMDIRGMITQEEVERFRQVELKRIDNPLYFRRYFSR
jgi:hypothetical protein